MKCCEQTLKSVKEKRLIAAETAERVVVGKAGPVQKC